MEKMVLTAPDIQIALGIGRRQVYELLNREDFPAIRLGRKIIVPREAFFRWLDAQADKQAG